MKDDIKWVKYSLVFCYYINIVMLKQKIVKADVDKKLSIHSFQ